LLASFLKGIVIVGESTPAVRSSKIRSFPSNKFEIIDTSGNIYELASNFMGSKYQLTKDGITHLTMTF
jgi:hypothetical protein